MAAGGRVKLADVARAAGVSVATVSKVVNGRGGVSRGTLERVLAVVDDLGYEASLGARSLRSLRTNVIGLLVREFEPVGTELLKGVSAAIGGTGYELIAYAGRHRDGPAGWERRSLVRLAGSVIDGAVVVTPTAVDVGLSGVPVVAVDPRTGSADVPTVDADHHRGAVTATEYLLGLGHRRIAFVGNRPDLASERLRERGFRAAMGAAGVGVEEHLVLGGTAHPGPVDGSPGRSARALLARADRPTAVFAADDLGAIRVIRIARSLGLAVPDDVSVVGFDNVPEAVLAEPALTTVAQPLQEIGATALRMLTGMLAGTPPDPAHVRLRTELVERASCRPL